MCQSCSPQPPVVPNPKDPRLNKPIPTPTLSLKQALDNAYKVEQANLEPVTNAINGFALKDKKAAISIWAIDNDDNHFYGARNDADMDFSASLLKMAAMYAAYDLRCAAIQFIKDNNDSFTDQNSFSTAFSNSIDTSNAVTLLQKFTKGLKPNVKSIFKGFNSSGPNKLDFIKNPTQIHTPSQGFGLDMDDMIIVSDDEAASRCIQAIGYSYINVSLMKGDFFNSSTMKGIWLAGDYESALQYFRVPCDNDTVAGGSAQATTTYAMGWLILLIDNLEALPQVTDNGERSSSNMEMRTRFRQAASWFSNGGSVVHVTEALKFSVLGAKVGVAGLGVGGNGPPVISEGSIVNWTDPDSPVTTFNTKFQTNLSGRFCFCWQNMYKPGSTNDFHCFDSLVRVLNATVTSFLTQ